MILRIPLSQCTLLRKNELNKEIILKNDAFKICTGCVDQYIVTEDNRLWGMISSRDIERELYKEGDIDVQKVINKDPLTIIQSARFEQKMVNDIFAKTYNIHSIPIIDRGGTIQYAYAKVNLTLQDFVKQNFQFDIDAYQQIIKQDIFSLKQVYPNAEIKILSDFAMYGLDLSDVKEYCISDEEIKSLNQENSFVFLVYLYDFNCMKVMPQLIKKGIRWKGINYTRKNEVTEVTSYFRMDEAAKETLEEEAYYNGEYFDLKDFENIFQAIRITENLKGCYLEIGTYRGDSAKAALSFIEKSKIKKKAFFLDTYEGFSYIEAKDSGDCVWANSHNDTSMEFVENRLKNYSDYWLVKSNIITDELPKEIDDIAVCNIDVDMYEAVESALEKVYKKVLPGGVIIAEDYGHTPALFGAQYAVSKFMQQHKNEFYGIYLQSGQYFMIKR